MAKTIFTTPPPSRVVITYKVTFEWQAFYAGTFLLIHSDLDLAC